MRNVGIVFSPTLGIPAGVFSLMLGEFNRVFNVDNANGAVETSPELRRNSRQYSDAAADQLLGLSGRSLSCTCLLVIDVVVLQLNLSFLHLQLSPRPKRRSPTVMIIQSKKKVQAAQRLKRAR